MRHPLNYGCAEQGRTRGLLRLGRNNRDEPPRGSANKPATVKPSPGPPVQITKRQNAREFERIRIRARNLQLVRLKAFANLQFDSRFFPSFDGMSVALSPAPAVTQPAETRQLPPLVSCPSFCSNQSVSRNGKGIFILFCSRRICISHGPPSRISPSFFCR